MVSFGLGLTQVFLVLTFYGCRPIPAPDIRYQTAESWAKAKGWTSSILKTRDFNLRSFSPNTPNRSRGSLTIYFEGDGLAWVSREGVSKDPSPIKPVGLELALAQPEGHAAYLGRPCQFMTDTDKAPCPSRYWTNERFSVVVIDSMNEAVDQLKQKFGAKKLILVGYSGGGTVAALIAARREDVERLITVAGNLDVTGWSEAHALSPLEGSLNPLDETPKLSKIPQVHFVGEKDSVIPPSLTRDFANKVHAKVIEKKDFDHTCCWGEAWSKLYLDALED